ncbi:MAG: F0F1 ATP synthase subunit A, partial [Clostridia bacterium]|nr:F0F1 ATP synthase subunit A [Clostridia bacterium]
SFLPYAPFICAILGLSATSSLTALVGAYPSTADLNTIAGWSILVFSLITFYKIKTNGFLGYLKSYTEPIKIFTPFNVLSEIGTPISMTFRHFGNIVSGVVISALVYAGLASVSTLLLGWLPGLLGKIPLLQVGLPAVLSIYFDVFTSLMQAFIFAMLTMLYIGNAAKTD